MGARSQPLSPRSGAGARILVVDDDAAARGALAATLRSHACEVDEASSADAALALLARTRYEVVLLDVNLPGRSGVDLLGQARPAAPDTIFIMMTAHGSMDSAIAAMRRGARDYLRKPLRTAELLRVLDRARFEARSRRHDALAAGSHGASPRLVGTSEPMAALRDRIAKVAPTRATALITGETGTGKELVAHAIHELSPRAGAPFVVTNCSSLSETLLESELFGHVKGSFTGAVDTRAGLFEEANRGTLFLDEVSTMSAGMQVKLLRVVQERVIHRVGSHAPIAVDLRLLAATNVDLEAEVARGAFREDLFYRLNVFPIRVPPLRERRGDIPLLARHFLERAAAQTGLAMPELPAATLGAMQEYEWPGNVRQLENFIESALIDQGDSIVFEPPRAGAARHEPAGGLPLAELERERIFEVLESTNGHRSRAASLLGIDRRTLYRKLKHYEARAERPAGDLAGEAP